MKILIVDAYYHKFLNSFYKKNGPFKNYDENLKHLLAACFGTSDYYSYNLKKIGQKAEEIVVNDETLQNKWALENNLITGRNRFVSKLQSLPLAYRFIGKPKWIQLIALEQIKRYKPDVVYVQDLSIFNPSTLSNIKKHCKLLIGQIASPVPPANNLRQFDLIITSFPHFVQRFRRMGIKSEYLKLAFEPMVLKKVGKQVRIYDTTFIGSFTPYHRRGTKVLEEVARNIPIHVWGQGIEFLSPFSPLRKYYHGEAWGLDMNRILAQSKIVINRHISVSENNANNMRLYEATGMGAMLITDSKKNLGELFEIGKEVVEYSKAEDLVKKINYYLNNDKKRFKIARAGQKRTIADYNYVVTMKTLVRLISRYI